MADLADVENAIVALIDATVYPTGTGNPSVTGGTVRVYRGWSDATALNADLAAGTVDVTVFADPGMTRNTSRFWPDPEQTAVIAPSVGTFVSPYIITVGGVTHTGQAVTATIGATPYTVAYSFGGLTSLVGSLASLLTGAGLTVSSTFNGLVGTITITAGLTGLLTVSAAGTGGNPPTLTIAASGSAVVLTGTIAAGDVVGIQAGAPVHAYATIVLAGDTLASLAARLAARISGATSSGAMIIMPSGANLAAAAMRPQATATEVRRQDQGFRVSIWTANPTQRDQVAGLIDNAIAGLRDVNGNLTRFLPILAGETGWIRYLRTYVVDTPTRAALWRRDLMYQIEYGTTMLELYPAMLFGGGALDVTAGLVIEDGIFGASAPAP